MYYKIPLTDGSQVFSIVLANVEYEMKFIYRESKYGGWFLDIRRVSDNKSIKGIPLIFGVDLLAQHEYLGFGHLIVSVDSSDRIYPFFEDMGTSLNIYWSE